ncbi:hypothetical protein TCAL_00828 [Tigriopus californicus]|uniref:Venom dipeptidyl peptidase 4 n=1 Tax=Tigriopus californicus TaxID=6832 RepID=A0A553NDW0_TIGCA|nr:venom dipeptidyl peptidase 4-like [Tigriopus californicus]TRY63634.1 hypothetical protein TCAL_00828 [Tigriopus californicus]|eukprot:TCALIF_00828-PA protein Name:"Similar to Venom dipeptidyl peptidase 4 (Apis mellifera)" AED:0.05 eAED:0.05 QI:407/1/1/1/0/0.5/2/21/798
MKILISFLGAALVVATVATTLILSLRPNAPQESMPLEQAKADGDPLAFDDIIQGKFYARTFNGKWWSDNEIQYKNSDGDLVLWNVETNTTKVLVSHEILSKFEASRFLGFAPHSDSLLLMASHVTPIWRHSFEANYVVYDALEDKSYPIFPQGSSADVKLQFASWANHPSENRLVFIHENNLFYKTDPKSADSEMQVTTDGVVDTIYNGKPDWVYEEEVLSSNNAIHISGDGKYLAFARFDDSAVEEFHYTKFGEPSDPYGNKYPNEIMVKYPKTGSSNPTVQFLVKDLDAPEDDLMTVIPPTEVTAFGDFLYTVADWTRDGVFSIIWMNRVQTQSIVSECSLQGGQWECVKVYETEETNGWIDLFQPPVYKSDGKEMLLILPNEFEGLHYRHLAKINIQGEKTTFLSSGNYIVTGVILWNEVDGLIYFTGTESGVPGARHLYSVSDSGDNSEPTCITCGLVMPSSGEPCLYNVVYISTNAQYYVHVCQGPQIPEVALRTMGQDSRVVQVLEDNAALQSELSTKAVAERMYMEVDVANGFKAPVRLLLPAGYDAAAIKRYPMIVHVYGGPDSQEVDYRWSVGWGDYFVSNYDVVYASIDGRGTGGQSNEFLFEVFRSLGTVEMQDQISVSESLAQQFAFLDPSRFAIWGWSYGGYATAMTLIQDTADVFACGISVAPPTDWLFYDTVYTERYMGLPTPEDNMGGYNQSSLLNKVENLRGKQFLLNHGVADDNVHFQQSMMLIRALELADIHFEQISYPDSNHGISNGVSPFLYSELQRFFGQCLDFTPVEHKMDLTSH